MAFTISSNATQMRCAAGEPIFLSYQPASADGVLEDLTGRSFVLSFYDNARSDKGTYQGTIVPGANPKVVWTLDGQVSDAFLGQTPLLVDLTERLDGTDRETIRTFTFNVTLSAPFPTGTNSGATSRYIVNVKRLNDAATIDQPKFEVSTLTYSTVPAPSFTVQPSVSGTPTVGQTLTASDGTVSNGTVSARQWLRNGNAISGAAGSTYILVTADAGAQVSFRATATGAGGTTSATSSAQTIAAAPVAPVFTTQPSMSPTSGTAGSTVFTANDGAASNATSYARRWLLNGTSVGTGTTVTPSSAGNLVLEVTATGSGGSTIATSASTTVTALAAPLAPTVTAVNGNGQGQLLITDNASSAAVQKWGIYKLPSSGGTPAFLTWAYAKDWRRALTNAATGEIYRVSAWNVSGESPLSPEVTISATATGFNALRLVATTLNTGEPFYEMLAPDFRTGSTVSVTASDGTSLSVKSKSGALIVYGTFATGGSKTLTFTETASGGATNTSTQTINVVAATYASYADVKSTAQAIKARIDNKPIYSDVTSIILTDMGGTMPAGYTGNYAAGDYASSSPPAASYSVVSNFGAPPTYFNVRGWDPVEKRANPGNEYIGLGTGNNTILRMKLFKQTFVVAFPDTSANNYSVNYKLRYSDDGMATWSEMAKPLLHRSATRFYKVDPGVAAPAGGRIWEIELSVYGQLANYTYAPGLGFESGETPQTVTDNSPVASGMVDSFMAIANAWDSSKGMLRQAARKLGLLNIWNAGSNQQRYTDPYSADTALGLNRIGDNVLGLGDLTNPVRNDLVFLNVTINDFSQSDMTQAQAMFRNLLLRTRRLKPQALIVLTLGFWSPDKSITTQNTALYNTIKSVAQTFRAQDKGFWFHDGVASGWAVPAGAVGSSPYFAASAGGTITGSTSGTTLTVTTGSGMELGMFLFNGATASSSSYVKAQVVEQLSGTTGGAGTYRLSNVPSTTFASGSTMSFAPEDSGGNPIHPSQTAGQPWMGQMLADGAIAAVNDILANAA